MAAGVINVVPVVGSPIAADRIDWVYFLSRPLNSRGDFHIATNVRKNPPYGEHYREYITQGMCGLALGSILSQEWRAIMERTGENICPECRKIYASLNNLEALAE